MRFYSISFYLGGIIQISNFVLQNVLTFIWISIWKQIFNSWFKKEIIQNIKGWITELSRPSFSIKT